MKEDSKKLKNELDRLLVNAFKEIGMTKAVAVKITQRSPNTVLHWYRHDDSGNTFLGDEFVEQVAEAASRIARGFISQKPLKYEKERDALLKTAEALVKADSKKKKEDKSYMRSPCEKMYTLGVVDLWSRIQANEQACIFNYAERIFGKYYDQLGSFFFIPMHLLPEKWFEHEKVNRPLLALTYEPKTGMTFCNEHGDCSAPVKMIFGNRNCQMPAPVEGKRVRNFCIDFFSRHNFDTSRDLRAQVQHVANTDKPAGGNFQITRYCPFNHRNIAHRVDYAASTSVGGVE
jgi:hypothetical protein